MTKDSSNEIHSESTNVDKDFDKHQAGSSFGTVRENSDIGIEEAWSANVKRTYDEYQHESLEAVRRNRSYVDKVLSDAQQHDNFRQEVANQALQNAVETANMVGKQAVRHGDLSIDRQWNVDEVSSLTAKTGFQQDLAAAVALAVATTLKEMGMAKDK